jgi:hypothetical protein
MKFGMFVPVLLALSGCASHPPPPPIWAEYDDCASQTTGFVAMVECGKRKRATVCQALDAAAADPTSRMGPRFWLLGIPDDPPRCSSIGNAFVQYADALGTQVTARQISEAEAMRQFAEYKTRLITDVGRNQAIDEAGRRAAAAAAAATPPPPAPPPMPTVPLVIPRY